MAAWVAVVVVLWALLFLLFVGWLVRPYNIDLDGARFGIPLRSTFRLYLGLAIGPSKPASFSAWEWHNAAHLYESYWLSPQNGRILLLIFRSVILIYFVLGYMIEGLAPSSIASGITANDLTFFTNWTYIGCGLQSLIGIIISIEGIRFASHQVDPDYRQYGFFSKLYGVVSATIPACSLFVTAFYWVVLYDPEDQLNIDNPWKHGANAVMLVIEAFLSRTPMTTSWIMWPAIYGTSYAVFMWVYFGISGEWVYDVLDFRSTSNLPYNIALPILVILFYVIMYLLVVLREYVARTVLKRRYRKSDASPVPPPSSQQVLVSE